MTARRITPSQLKSKLRQIENKNKQALNNFNRKVNEYNRKAKEYNRKVEQARQQFNRDVRMHNAKVRIHNAKVKQNRVKIANEIRRLNSQASNNRTVTYTTSVKRVHVAYSNVAQHYDSIVEPTPFQEQFYDSVEQENANNIETANAIENKEQRETVPYSLQDTKIIAQLKNISSDLDNRWRGAIFSLDPSNPDATRHFCTSSREIFTEIFTQKATDEEVFSVFPNSEVTQQGNATRRAKIKYFLNKKGIDDSQAEVFVEEDIANILELFHVLSDGTHGQAGKYTITQLLSVKQRVEDGLIFLCSIAS